MFYIPNGTGRKLSVTVDVERKEGKDFIGNPQVYNIIKKIVVGARDITNTMKGRFYVQNATKDALANAIAAHITALPNDIQFNPDIPNDNLYINK